MSGHEPRTVAEPTPVTAPEVARHVPGIDLRALAWRLDTRRGIGALVAAALLLRVLIAPHVGFLGDLGLFREWAMRMAEVGPREFYVEGKLQDYPPGYLYVLWTLGKLSASPSYLLLKLPPILADIGIAWVAGLVAERIAPKRLLERWPVRTLTTASVLFNPAFIALSAGWGQVDSVPAFFTLSALLLLFTGRRTFSRDVCALLLFAVAVSMKPQSGFVLPVMLYALFRRYLHRRHGQTLLDGAISVGLIAVASLLVWSVSGLPFGMGPAALVRFYRDSASIYPVTSANAFNSWGALGFWRNDSTGENVMRIVGMPASLIGTLAFLTGLILILRWLHRRLAAGQAAAPLLVAASGAVSLLAFLVLTRMHERYLFLALAVLAPIVVARPVRWWYAALSVLFVVNLWHPYGYYNALWGASAALKPQPLFGWVFGGDATDTWQRTLWSVAVTGVGAAVIWTAMRWAGRLAPTVSAPVGHAGSARDTPLPGATPTAPALPRRPAVPTAPGSLEQEGEAPLLTLLRDHVVRSRRLLTCVGLAVTAVYLPALIVPYAISDDYSFLWMTNGGGRSPWFGRSLVDLAGSEGRIVKGVIDQLSFSAATTIADLRFVRAFAVAGIVLLALLVQWALVRAAVRPFAAALVAVLIVTMPAFQVYASWAVLSSAPYAAVLAGCSSLLVDDAVRRRRRTVAALGVPVLLMVIALSIYQPAAMFIWVFLAIALVRARYEPVHALRTFLVHGAVALGGLIAWYGVRKVCVAVIGDNGPGGSRGRLTDDPGGKLDWFVHEPLYRSLNLSDLTPGRQLALLIGFVAVGGIVSWLVTAGTRPLRYALMGLALVPLAYLPNLLDQESWAAPRTQVALVSLIALYAALGAMGHLTVGRDILQTGSGAAVVRRSSAVAVAAMAVVVVASCVLATKNVITLMAHPQMTELRLVRNQVAAIPSGSARIGVVETDWFGGMAPFVLYDDFGLPSTAQRGTVTPWAIEPMIDLILREQGRLGIGSVRPAIDYYAPGTTTLPSGQPVIDVRELGQLR